MSYKRVKAVGANCPNCQRKLDILLTDTAHTALCMCFRCRAVYTFDGQEVKKLSVSKQTALQEKELLHRLVQALPEKHSYKGQGSQLRQQEWGFQRSWLSLAEYERQFGEALGFNACDLRKEKQTCKWCGNRLPQGRRSFCKDSCSRNYSQATFTKRHMGSVPYRIACRDRFYCRISGEDLAQYNRHGVRIPASNGELAIHHLIFVSQNGTDHEQNLLTVSAEIHKAYHSGDPTVVEAIHTIREEQLKQYADKMQF
ncbi:hypothetical protein [Candidatus Enterococcus clewellii]|uniref:Uncharacterized protein n=1 Tax=Candidatus Enterococcus clewellii TaxID=1834193 RepID=A0A242JZ55_9ENTE|nr:hypothetical protein [Enterococcus sp. 9E7_DIV0242]OTP10598.1 hypothetical protein A5888_003896 [Enterococcus sp. 9E7_DIV0242]